LGIYIIALTEFGEKDIRIKYITHLGVKILAWITIQVDNWAISKFKNRNIIDFIL